MFYLHLRIKCILLLLNKSLSICTLGLFGIKCHSNSLFPYWLSTWWSIHGSKWGMKFPTIIALMYIFSFRTASSCFMYLSDPILQRRQWHPTPVLLTGNSHGQRSQVGCSPQGHWELDTTQWLHFHFSLSCIGEGNGNPLQYSCLEHPMERGAR